MKNILHLSTAADLQTWDDYFLVVKSPDISVDSVTGLNRAAVVKNFNISPENQSVLVSIVLYLLDSNGNPINGYTNKDHMNILPVEVTIPANNDSYVSLTTFEVISDLTGLTYGVDYLEEFEAYRQLAKSQDIDLFELMARAIITSSKI